MPGPPAPRVRRPPSVHAIITHGGNLLVAADYSPQQEPTKGYFSGSWAQLVHVRAGSCAPGDVGCVFPWYVFVDDAEGREKGWFPLALLSVYLDTDLGRIHSFSPKA